MLNAQTVRGHAFSYATAQDIGGRPDQEDRFLVQELTTADGRAATLALVADGIGGHNEGQAASQMARERVPAHLAARGPDAAGIGGALRAALEDTCRDIYEASLLDPRRAAMGTTCTAVVVVDRRLYLAHVGDTRLYFLREDRLTQLSIDHTWGEEAIRAGFPPEDIRRHPNRGVLRRFLGIEPTVQVDTRYRLDGDDRSTRDSLAEPLLLAPGDALLLCSDGVADTLEPADVLAGLRAGNPGQAAAALVQKALDAGATDNVTAVALRLIGGRTGGPWWKVGE